MLRRALILAIFCFVTAAAQAATVTDRSAVGELAFWNSVKDSKQADDLKTYIDEFPNGMFIDPALERYRVLTGEKLAALPEDNEVQAAQPAKPAMSKPKTATKKQVFKRPLASKAKTVRPTAGKQTACKSGVIRNGKCVVNVAVRKKQVIRSGNDVSSSKSGDSSSSQSEGGKGWQ